MWNALCAAFERKSCQSQTLVRKELANLKLNEGGDLNAHLLKFDSLVRQWKTSGGSPSEQDLVSQLFISLPGTFDPVVTALENLSESDLKLSDVKCRLLAEDIKLKNRAVESSLQNVSTTFSAKTKFKGKFNGRCHKCGKFGHKKVDCRCKVNNMAAVTKTGVRFMADSSTGNKGTVLKSEIIFALDSGATDHFINDKTVFMELFQLRSPKEIFVAKTNQSILVTEIGTVEGFSNTGIPIKLKNVLHSPEFRENLLSVSKMLQAGITVKFQDNQATINKGVTTAVAERFGNLFQLKIKIPNQVANISKVESGNLWHKRLGHISNGRLNELAQKNMVHGIENVSPVEFCEICTQSRQTKKPFDGTRSKSLRPLEHIHSDLCGPINPVTWDGHKYFLTFIDDYTHFTMVYLINNKSDTFEKFKEYEAEVTAKFSAKISKLTIDQGREYKSKNMLQLCKSKAIQVLESMAYSPQQNGVAERFNRTVTEKVRALLLQSSVPKFLWGEAVYASTYILNRCPSRAVNTNKTPAELWFGHKPNLSKVRVFGCQAFALVPDQHRKKLDAKSIELVMVGYCANGYRLWDINKNKIVSNRNVVFNETNFPFYEKSRITIRDEDLLVYKIEQEEEQNQNLSPDLLENNNITVGEIQEPHNVNDVDVVSAPVQSTQDEELRRSRRLQKLPPDFSEYIHSLFETCAKDTTPNSYQEMRMSANVNQWMKAVNEELKSMETNKVWKIMKNPGKIKPLKSKWVFKLKEDEYGHPIRYKARLIAKGYLQKPGVDYDETYSPVAKLTTLRIVLAVGVHRNMYFHRLDVKTAFLYGDLDENVYLNVPEGMQVEEPDVVLKLQKSLYELKQSPRCWNNKFNSTLINLGFKRSAHDYCLMEDCKGARTPMEKGLQLSEASSNETSTNTESY